MVTTESKFAKATRTVTRSRFDYRIETVAGVSLTVSGRGCKFPQRAVPQGIAYETMDEATGTGRRSDALYTLAQTVLPAKCKRIVIIIETGEQASKRYRKRRPRDLRDR